MAHPPGGLLGILLLGLVIASCCLSPATGSHWDPHRPPSRSFFEGWFLRITSRQPLGADLEKARGPKSVALIFGAYPGSRWPGPGEKTTTAPSADDAPADLVGAGLCLGCPHHHHHHDEHPPFLPGHTTFAAILVAGADEGEPVQVFHAHPARDSVGISIDGEPGVPSDPDPLAPPRAFKFTSDVGSFESSAGGDTVAFDFTIQGARLVGRSTSIDASASPGPSLLPPPAVSPVKSNWFVYSLNSSVEFELDLPTTASLRSEDDASPDVVAATGSSPLPPGHHKGVGSLHAEKNWGYAFPRAWVWAQGHLGRSHVTDTTSPPGVDEPVSFVVTGVPLLKWMPGRAYVATYRSREREWTFVSPVPSVLRRGHVDACLGRVELVFEDAIGIIKRRTLNITIEADPASFSRPIPTPTSLGFLPYAVQSYGARAFITLTVRRGPIWNPTTEVVEQLMIPASALEFGGREICTHNVHDAVTEAIEAIAQAEP